MAEINHHMSSSTGTQTLAKPIIRWAGSKKNHIDLILNNFPRTFSNYREPFAGSMCVCLKLNPKSADISDSNPELINLYQQLQSNPREIFKILVSWPRDAFTYKEIRGLHSGLSATQRAARFLYLNRNCFNGVYRTNQKGEFNVPMGTRTGSYPSLSEIVAFSKQISKFTFTCVDFSDAIELVKENEVVYLDPPYTTSERKTTGEYGPKAFSVADLEKLLGSLKDISLRGAKFILSYKEDSDFIESLDPSWKIQSYQTTRHVAGFSKHRLQVRDVIVRNW